MAYVTKADLETNIRLYRLEQIIDEDDTKIDEASNDAEAIIRDALSDRYDHASIFAKTGADRHNNVLGWAKYITLYKLYERTPDEMVPERIVKNYDDTLKILAKIADGSRAVILPRIITAEGAKKTKFRWGSQPKRPH